jgi:RNA polymerase sigma factor (sigma-70 family)
MLERYLPMLRRYVRRMSSSSEAADELMQETCLQILRLSTAPLSPRQFSCWCRGVARNLAAHHYRDKLRKRKRLVEEEKVPELVDLGPSPEARVSASQTLDRITSDIDPEPLLLLFRHHVMGERIRDLADERGQSAASLRMSMMRLRAALTRSRR